MITPGKKALYFSIPIYWIVGLGAIGIVGYSIYDNANPTGNTRLISLGYTFNPPQFTKHENLDHGCHANLFKEDEGFEKDKLYGCGVANMELWDSGNQFAAHNKTVDYLNFNSEIAMRKGDDGWKINTKFDSLSGPLAEYSHYITTYDHASGVWKEKDTFLISADTDHEIAHTTADITFDRPTDNKKYEILSGLRDLTIKVPSGSWYQKQDYLLTYQEETTGAGNPSTREGLFEYSKTQKHWSGIWLEDERSSASWIFQDIEIFIEEKKYSRFFCKNKAEKNNDCWQSIDTELDGTKFYKKEDNTFSGEEMRTWKNVNNTYKIKEGGKPNDEAAQKVQPIIEKIKDIEGRWINTEEFCNYGHERHISEEQFKNLRMFCAKQITNP